MRDGGEVGEERKKNESTHLGYRQMDYEHFAFVVDLLDFRPVEMVRLARALKREDPVVIDA